MGGTTGGVISFAIMIAILIAAAAICKKYLGYSHLNFLKSAIEEFRELGKIKWNPQSINALTIIICAILALIYFASSSLEKLVRLAFSLGQVASQFPQIIATIFVIGLLGMVCILLCNKAA